MKKISSWGYLNNDLHDLFYYRSPGDLTDYVSRYGKVIPFGMARSYGDVCLNAGAGLCSTEYLDKYISFDVKSGVLKCESGIQLGQIQKLCVTRGWFLPVSPGTQFVTVGGAIANDVHGKNHYRQGSFGNHLISLKVLRTNGDVINCDRRNNVDLFRATIGGLGLTGLILEAEIQLRKIASSYLEVEFIPYESLEDFFRIDSESHEDWEYTVSWFDCISNRLGRGIYQRARHCSGNDYSHPKAKVKRNLIPFTPPFSLVNRLSLSIFNTVYFNFYKNRKGISKTHYEPFLYPLDGVMNWNRIYGTKGFFQHQCVVPTVVAYDASLQIIREISRQKQGSFLAVLKNFGFIKPEGMLSFPLEGTTVALDFPNLGEKTEKLFERLDGIVHEAGGRLYPAKDARMSKELFIKGYPQYEVFKQYCDPGCSSSLSRRLLGK
ncbi:MAG: FAD-binding oxidoreductase [Burkholderiales bacterium]|jgi:FAD/FMN-containing dehydrogenase|nr:FAD-binding oxidoreductase [Burkholderiales bacterium]MCA3162072.1 FAD-binding oxidoreductase [Burkholderiales bacterium]MCA3163761.1 FAD-binding oxidoreductase [Burkholderiales bacterium]MCA3165619.1 FAD-binding oxidoreductase [Burkholderiales bacterium]MCA3169851.1 FAD-binding oxidoreductase [Burkholderiales bacterium]